MGVLFNIFLIGPPIINHDFGHSQSQGPVGSRLYLNEDIREFLCRKGFLHIHDNQFAAPGFICLHAADSQMVGVIRIIPPSQIGVGPSHIRDRKSIGHGFPCHIAGMPAAAGFRAVIAAPKGKCQTL